MDITTTPTVTTTPALSVVVHIDTDTTTPVTGTLYRLVGGEATPVRGGAGVTVAGSTIVRDYDAPTNVEVRYYFETGGGADNTTNSTVVATGDAWLTSPANPFLALPLTCGKWHTEDGLPAPTATVRLSSESLDTVDHKPEGETTFVIGSKRPIYRGSTGITTTIPLTLTAYTRDDVHRVQALLEEGRPLLLRALPCMPEIPDGWVHIAPEWEVRRTPTASHPDRHQFVIRGVVVRAPGGNRVLPAWTWDDVTALYPTWADLRVAKATWVDVLEDPRP